MRDFPEARLKLLTQGPRAEDLRAAELALDQARNSLMELHG